MTTETEEEKISRLEAIQQILDYGLAERFTVCLGVPYCDRPADDDGEDCVWCHMVYADDNETAQEIEDAILRKQRGH